MKRQLFVCMSALAFAAAAISAPQIHNSKQAASFVSLNDTVPGKNKIHSTDSAKEWHNNADRDVKDTMYKRRDSSGHAHDTTRNLQQ